MEAAGQLIHLFRDGPDYAFTRTLNIQGRVRSVLSITRCRWILVPALLVAEVSRSMSLYRADLRLALFPPLGVTAAAAIVGRWSAPSGFADVSPVVTSLLRVKATQVDRTRVRKHYATGHYMLSPFFDSRHALPEGQGRRTASCRAF